MALTRRQMLGIGGLAAIAGGAGLFFLGRASNSQSIPDSVQTQQTHHSNRGTFNLREIAEGQITYEPKHRGYRVKGDFQLKGLKVGEYSNEDENYLFFDGAEHQDLDQPYISMGKTKLVLGVPANGFGSTIQLLPGNQYLDLTPENFVMIQALGGKRQGHIWVERKDWDGKIPRISSSSGYNVFNGQRVVKYSDLIESKNRGPIILDENPANCQGRLPIPLHLVTTDKIGQRLQGYDIVFDRFGRITAGNWRELLNYPGSLRDGEYSSIKLAYHNLSSDEQDAIKAQAIEKEMKKQGYLTETEISRITPGKRVRYPEEVPTPEGFSGGDGIEPEIKRPILSKQMNAAFFEGEEYKRIPNSNKFIAPSGKYFIAN